MSTMTADGRLTRIFLALFAMSAGAQQVSLPTEISRSHQLVTTISVGTPPQEIRCLLDSGSTDLWVPSKRCRSCQNERYFHADRSSTFAPKLQQTLVGMQPRAVTVSYGSGQISGFDVQDTVTFGSVELKNQTFIIVEDAALPPNRGWDGICGLGWSGIAQASGMPLYQNLQDKGHKAVLTVTPASLREASLHLGEVPETSYKPGSLAWADVQPLDPGTGAVGSKRSFWVVPGGVAIVKRKPAHVRFLVDTGTNQALLVPPKYYPSIVSSLLPNDVFGRFCEAHGAVVLCDCSVTEAELKPLRIYLGDRSFSLTATELFAKVHPHDKEVCLLQVRPNPLTQSVLGSSGGILGGLLGDLLHPHFPMPPMPPMPGFDPNGLLGKLFGPSLVGVAPDGAAARGDGPPGLRGARGAPGMPEQLPPMPGFGPGGMLGGPLFGNPAAGDASSRSPQDPATGLGGLLGPQPWPPQNASRDPFGGLLGKMLGPLPLPPGASSSVAISSTSSGGSGVADSETRVVTRTMPNGTVCTSTLVLEGGRVQKNETRCVSRHAASERATTQAPTADSEDKTTDPDSEQSYLEQDAVQRWQLAGFPELRPTPTDDFWVLGGVFLERFVVAFDYDNARLGIAEPSAEIKPELQVLGLNEERVIEVQPPVEAPGKPASSIAWPVLAAPSLVLGVGVLAAWYRSSRRRPEALASTSDLEAVE